MATATSQIIVTQKNPSTLASGHTVSNPAVLRMNGASR
jgi:hypothetical protein